MPIKVMIVASHAPSLINFRGPLIREMSRLGYEIYTTAPELSTEIEKQLIEWNTHPLDTPLKRTSKNPIHDLVYLASLVRILIRVKPDYILTYTPKPNIWGGIASRVLRIHSASMVTGLGFVFVNSPGIRSYVLKKITSLLYRASTAGNHTVMFQNDDDRNDFIEAGCLAEPRKARIVNGSGVDLSHYSPRPLPKNFNFLMISRLIISKGVREYAEACIELSKAHPDVGFQLIGDFDHGPDSISAEELNTWVSKGFTFLGPTSDVRPALERCSVFVLPSYREGTPRSVLEAMAIGRPILTTDAPGCRETTIHGHNGFLVPIQDADALKRRMEWFINNQSTARSMGDASLEIVKAKYDVRKVNRSIFHHLGLTLDS